MKKIIFAAIFLAFALGGIAGYLINEIVRSPQITGQAIAAPAVTTSPKPVPLTRIDLEQRYIKAVTAFGFRIDEANLKALTDKQLNDEVARLEQLLRSKS
jgi:hypothetical protein